MYRNGRLAGCVLMIAAVSPGLPNNLAHGASENSYFTYADVVDVEPVLQRTTVNRPREVCETYAGESYASQPYGSTGFGDVYGTSRFDGPRHKPGPGPGIVGGIIGGLIGNQFGGGRGKKLLTITGALAGAAIADNAAKDRYRRQHRRVTVPRARECWTVDDVASVNRVSSYRVTYRYYGQEFVKNMSSHPGDRVRIRVSVAPTF